MASAINKEGRRLEFTRDMAAQNHKVENYEGFAHQKKEDPRQRDSNLSLVQPDPHVQPNPQSTTRKKTIKFFLSPFEFYFQIALHQEIYETSERWAGPWATDSPHTAFSATFTLPLPYT